VKEYAKKNNMSYSKALTDPDLKKDYVPTVKAGSAKKEKSMSKQKGKKDKQL
jgi:hypothetical protein